VLLVARSEELDVERASEPCRRDDSTTQPLTPSLPAKSLVFRLNFAFGPCYLLPALGPRRYTTFLLSAEILAAYRGDLWAETWHELGAFLNLNPGRSHRL